MGNLTVPQAISLIGGLPIEVCERAWSVAGEYADANTTGSGSESWYVGKWKAMAGSIGHEFAFRFAQQELFACFGDDEQAFNELHDWLDAWDAAAKKGAN